jgi:recombination protein RecT
MNQLVHFQQALTEKRGAIAGRLPAHMNPDRLIKIAITAAAKNPRILDCDRESVMLSIMQAAELGLEPGGALGEGYLVPYGKTCQFIPGYRGMISLARRSGQIVSIEAHAVFEADEFLVEFGLDPKLVHKPTMKAERGNVIAFYAVAKIVGGGIQYDYMTKTDVDAIRSRSKASGSGPWVTDYNEMGKKTVIRRLFKVLPVSVELCRALELHAESEAGEFDASLEVLQADAERVASAQEIAAQVAGERAA